MPGCTVATLLSRLTIWIQLCTIHLHLALPALVFELSYISSVTDLGPINHVLVSHTLLPLTWAIGFCTSFQCILFHTVTIMYCYVHCTVLYCYVHCTSCILWQMNIYIYIYQCLFLSLLRQILQIKPNKNSVNIHAGKSIYLATIRHYFTVLTNKFRYTRSYNISLLQNNVCIYN